MYFWPSCAAWSQDGGLLKALGAALARAACWAHRAVHAICAVDLVSKLLRF